MIPAESRMREIRTSGSMSRGVETDLLGAGLSTGAKAMEPKAPDPTGTAPPPDSTCVYYRLRAPPEIGVEAESRLERARLGHAPASGDYPPVGEANLQRPSHASVLGVGRGPVVDDSK